MAAAATAAAALWAAGGCESPMERIDRRTTDLIMGTSGGLGPEATTPPLWGGAGPPPEAPFGDEYSTRLRTANPSASELRYTPADEAADVNERLDTYAREPEDAIVLDLKGALRYAMRHSRAYRFAEEEYILAALRLLAERHLWGPRLFDDLSAAVTSTGDGGLYDSALEIVNDLRLTQRLPYGGEVSARLLAAATEDLHERVAGENVQSAEIILAADVPLLRGAGPIAREALIQLERDVIYAARRFERFRREFLFDITTEFLDLVVRQLAIVNAERQVEQLQRFEDREVALVEAGRDEPFQAALAAQSTLFARDNLNRQRETYRLALDRFRIRIGMEEDQAGVIAPDTPDLAVPAVDMQEAVRAAMTYRLDLQNTRDQVDDSRRAVANARNLILPDLNLSGSIAIPTDDSRDRAGLDFALDDTVYRASVTLGLPLDREVERLALRRSQIDLERAILDYDQFRDLIAVEVRAAVRNIDRALFSRNLQERNVEVAELRLASIEAAPDRATARDRSDAADDLLRARDDLLAARRDLQVNIMRYLLDSGQLRVAPDGTILPLRGMEQPTPPAPGAEEGAPDERAPGAAGTAPPPAPESGRDGSAPTPEPARQQQEPEEPGR